LTYQDSEVGLKGLGVGYILLTKVTTSRIAKRTVLAPNPLEGIELKPISLSLGDVLCQGPVKATDNPGIIGYTCLNKIFQFFSEGLGNLSL